MPVRFTPAPEAVDIAADLIPAHHPHLIDHAVRVEILWRNDIPSRSGRPVWGDCRKITNLAAYLAGPLAGQEQGDTEPFFVITLSRPVWTCLTAAQRVALVDHQLCHAGAEEDDEGRTRLVVRAHDLEEFTGVVHRHGIWRPDISAFLESARTGPSGQLALQILEGDTP